MAGRRRHSASEITSKLAQAEALIAQGERQLDICHSLGISIMTFHRWRKARNQAPSEIIAASDDVALQHLSKRVAELEVENARLRRLVTDLLLEKRGLEEAQAGGPKPGV